MDSVDALVEQHVKESELRLRHVDELMARAQQTKTVAAAEPVVDALLARIEGERRTLRHALDRMRAEVPDERAAAVHETRGLIAGLETLGLELEKVLATIGDRRGV